MATFFLFPALDIVDTLVKSAAVDMVVVDSVAALVPKAELEGEMGDHHIALQVKMCWVMGVFMVHTYLAEVQCLQDVPDTYYVLPT